MWQSMMRRRNCPTNSAASASSPSPHATTVAGDMLILLEKVIKYHNTLRSALFGIRRAPLFSWSRWWWTSECRRIEQPPSALKAASMSGGEASDTPL
jgi:hypothetical protein